MATKRILVVEDDTSTREAWRELIKSWGFEVEVAEDGVAGLDRIASYSPDIMLLDLRLPRKDGLTVLREVREKGIDLQIIVISGEGEIPDAVLVKQPLATNARAKMQGFRDGFVKIIARRSTGTVLGGVIVAPRASELILAISLAVERQLTVDHLAHTFAVYPSLSGSLTEAARKLMQPAEDTS